MKCTRTECDWFVKYLAHYLYFEVKSHVYWAVSASCGVWLNSGGAPRPYFWPILTFRCSCLRRSRLFFKYWPFLVDIHALYSFVAICRASWASCTRFGGRLSNEKLKIASVFLHANRTNAVFLWHEVPKQFSLFMHERQIYIHSSLVYSMFALCLLAVRINCGWSENTRQISNRWLGEFSFVSRRFASRIYEISDLKEKALVLSLGGEYTRLRDQ